MGDAYTIARDRNMEVITITNFEHLADTLEKMKDAGVESYVGMCCGEFFLKRHHAFRNSGMDAVLLDIHAEIAEFERFAIRCTGGAIEVALDSRHQLRHRIGLHDIIVRAGFQPAHAVDFLGPGGQHDDRDVPRLPVGLQTAADFDAGDFRQHPVEDDQRRLFLFDQHHRVRPVQRRHRHIALGLQVDRQEFLLRRFVLDDEDLPTVAVVHGQSPCPPAGR